MGPETSAGQGRLKNIRGMRFPQKSLQGREGNCRFGPGGEFHSCPGPGMDAVGFGGQAQLQQLEHCSRHLSSVCGRVTAVAAVPFPIAVNCCVEAARCSRSRQARNCKWRNSAAVPQAAAVAFGQNLEGSGRETASISCFFVIPGLFLLPVSLSTLFQLSNPLRGGAELPT